MAKRGGHITPKQKSYLEDLIAKLYEAYEDPKALDHPLAETLRDEGKFGIANCSKQAASERIDQAKALIAQNTQGAENEPIRQRPASERTVERRAHRRTGRNEPLYDLNPLDPMAERIS